MQSPRIGSSGEVYGISGTVIDFSLDVSNTGTNNFHGFVQCQLPSADVMDIEPGVGSPITWSWTQGGDTVEMDNYVDVASNATFHLSFSGIITQQSWTSFPITCRLYSGDTTPFLVDVATANIDPIADLQVVKTLGDNPSDPGDLITFNTHISNIGSAPAQNYVFRDMPLPQAFFVFPQWWTQEFA
ncbi:MAG: hypothetical protein GXP45_03605 [bacterium]|nr:hypothetical protein [bacterium]